jgi:hypothetical protein
MPGIVRVKASVVSLTVSTVFSSVPPNFQTDAELAVAPTVALNPTAIVAASIGMPLPGLTLAS